MRIALLEGDGIAIRNVIKSGTNFARENWGII